MMVDQAVGKHINLSNAARIAVFAALAFGINAPFLAIPNIETFSLSLFLTGLLLGKFNGVMASLIAGLIFIFFNPNGPQPVILVGLAQLTGFMLFGLFGGLLRGPILSHPDTVKSSLILASAGLILTFWYDFSTNLVFAVMFGPFWPTIIGGLSFGIVHLISNTAMFALSGAVVYKIWKRVEFYLPPLAG